MLSAEAVRLAAIEILCPTAAAISGEGLPTLAGVRVFDSRAASIEDLDRARDYTPVLALYTPESASAPRGEMSDAADADATAILEVMAELSVAATDGGEEFADAMADTDPVARLVLMALCAQVRKLLEHSQSGGLWRKLVKRIVRVEYQSFAVPELGLRWQRTRMRYQLEIRDDDFDMEAGGLPAPLNRVFEDLPNESYAKAKLAQLAAAFAGEAIPPLQSIHLTTGPIVSGPDFTDP